jgi:hypothetical protein
VSQALVLCEVYLEAAEINKHLEVYVLPAVHAESEAAGQH